MLEIPGSVIEDRDRGMFLKRRVAEMCGVEHLRFPGAQPVSFKVSDLTRLQHQDYWVCEKSDGIRVLLFILPFPEGQEVYLIDRKNNYRLVEGLYFPHPENKQRPLGSTLVDGELVLDIDPATKAATMRFLAFDCLVCDDQNVMGKPLQKRYGRLKMFVLDPFFRMLQELPQMRASLPFQVLLKKMELAYAIEKVLKEDVPKLQHESDGLIYTNAETNYVLGTDPSLLKWKPPSENTIDYKLELRFPPLPSPSSGSHSSQEPDFSAKPYFLLNAFHGDNARGGSYQFFDMMDVESDEWEKMKATGAQYDDRIVEVSWDKEKENWKFMRFRDDKTDGNHISVVQNIIESIIDGVESDELLASASAVKVAWKARESARQRGELPMPGQGPPPSTSYHGQPQSSNQQAAPPPRAGAIWSFPFDPPENLAEDDIRLGPLYSRVSGPLHVDGIWR